MDYSSSYFGKPLNEIKYEDIVDYFAQEQVETETIEFKSYHQSEGFESSLNLVIRGISSFLNSSGGIIIWGAPKGIKRNSDKIFIGKLSPVKTYKNKDTLINKIAGVITPMPINISIETLSTDESNFV